MPLSIGHYLNNMPKLTDQWNSKNYMEPDRQRIYLKDIDCPQLWHDKLKEQIPPSIFYLNNSTGDLGGPGSHNAHERGIARCGDLMSCLPPDMRAENMMCYIGHEGTYTPAHREMCASLGHNLMVETSGSKNEEGKTTRSGSSVWFMTETKDRDLVSEYWLSTLGHDIEVEKHFAQIAAWKHAPFTTYVVEQRAGDFILIPPLAPHQVWNRGTRTMKVAWNRTTVETLELALHEALPRARMVCRDEQYKNKAIIYFTLHKYSDLLNEVDVQMRSTQNPLILDSLKYSTKIRQLQKDFKRLFVLYTEILLSEMLAPVSPTEKRGQYLPFESFITCSYCRCNIFNRFLTCTTCVELLTNGEEDTYDVCMDCFAMGRSCRCISAYKWIEQFPWQDLIQKHEIWRQQIVNFEGVVNEKSPKSLQTERKNLKKRTLAQVCQEQLKIRPWSDPKNPLQALTHAQKRDIGRPPTSEVNGEDDPDEDGHPKKKAKRKDYIGTNYLIEHVSLHPEDKWKLATCTKCDRSYSYGSLWRMFDLMPLTVMEDPQWQCPYCLKICSCGACRRRGIMKPYEPKGTILGHDTKAVADRRSMEHLVDFSHSNIRWITAVGDDNPNESRRLHRRIEEAEIAKSQDPALDDNYIDAADDGLFVDNDTLIQEIPIDPMLDPALFPGEVPQTKGRAPSTNRAPSTRPSSSAQKRQGLATIAGSNSDSAVAHGSSAYGTDIGLRPPTGNTSALGEDHPASFVSNGITYEYPDPTDSQNLLTNHASQPNQPSQTSTKKASAKRKSDYNLIQPDLAPDVPNTSLGNLSQNQLQQKLQEAKENGRYTIAEAALTGKSLVVTLPVSANQLATISQNRPSSDAARGSTITTKDVLQSDLPDRDMGGSKRKKAKADDENDSDFRIRQRKDRLSTIGAPTAAKAVRSNRANYTAADSSSEDEDILMVDAEGTSTKQRGPRPLPKYLAQRSEGQGLPDELSLEEPRRRSVPRTKEDHMGKVEPQSNKNLPENKRVSASTGRPVGRPPKKRPAEQPSPAEKLAEENRKAKMKAVSWADHGQEEATSSERSTSEDESPEPIKKKAGRLMAVPMSMFERKGMAGKKFKVASAKTAGINGQSKRKP